MVPDPVEYSSVESSQGTVSPIESTRVRAGAELPFYLLLQHFSLFRLLAFSARCPSPCVCVCELQ